MLNFIQQKKCLIGLLVKNRINKDWLPYISNDSTETEQQSVTLK